MQICLQNNCVSSNLAPVGNCVFGDDLVTNLQVIPDPLPMSQMTCGSVTDYLIAEKNQFAYAYCLNPIFRFTCCNFCISN